MHTRQILFKLSYIININTPLKSTLYVVRYSPLLLMYVVSIYPFLVHLLFIP